MSAPETKRAPQFSLAVVLRTLSGKLLLVLLASLAMVFGLLGVLNIRSQQRHLERLTLDTAQRLSSVIIRDTNYSMLHNQREAIYHSISDVAKEPGIERIRILDDQGLITYSSDSDEIGMYLNKDMSPSTQPIVSHGIGLPFEKQRFRIFTQSQGGRILAITTPIANAPACWSASCHAHSESEQVLGALDTSVSLATTDAALASSTRQTLLYLILGGLLISGLAVAFVSYMVHGPLLALTEGTRHLRAGDLGYQIKVSSHDELAILANSFNRMSHKLRDANDEINAWTRTLEARVAEKTQQLRGAQDEMLRVERMASIGKLAAVVAHEINNPLAGILTYSKLLKKRLQRSENADKESIEMLDLMESESRRCGEIVRNLMTFGRPTSMNSAPCNLNAILDRCIKLVQHQLELKNIEPHLQLDEQLPIIQCDPGQAEQVVLALVINAIDAMPNGGNLTLATRRLADSPNIQIVVRDDGVGMPPEVMANMFEPFFTTKEKGRGLGLGLAISRNIVERHQGRIQVASEPGRGTEFTITLPLQADFVQASPVAVGGREGT